MAKTWRWDSEHRCCADCPPDSSLVLEGKGVRYVGWCSNVCYGGGYTIGFQSVDEFLAQGPLDDTMPPKLTAEIRAYLTAKQADRGHRDASAGQERESGGEES